MKLAVIVPDRGDRPDLFKNCKRMIEAQTLKPYHVVYVTFDPVNNNVDITKRYRIGYDSLRHQQYDLIAFMESDDWYAPDYLETMVKQWELEGKPDLFGTNMSVYYHIVKRKSFTMRHYERSAMMNTFIKPDLHISWPLDTDPYTDVWLWMGNSGITSKKVFEPTKWISLGIKHGVGKTGGHNHTTKMHRYIHDDASMNWFLNVVDSESYIFYFVYAETLKVKK